MMHPSTIAAINAFRESVADPDVSCKDLAAKAEALENQLKLEPDYTATSDTVIIRWPETDRQALYAAVVTVSGKHKLYPYMMFMEIALYFDLIKPHPNKPNKWAYTDKCIDLLATNE